MSLKLQILLTALFGSGVLILMSLSFFGTIHPILWILGFLWVIMLGCFYGMHQIDKRLQQIRDDFQNDFNKLKDHAKKKST